MKLGIKEYTIIILLLVCGILAYFLYTSLAANQNLQDTINQSKGRVEVMQQQISELKWEYNLLELKNDSLKTAIQLNESNRTKINTKYDAKISRLITLPIDSHILYLSNKLSETNGN